MLQEIKVYLLLFAPIDMVIRVTGIYTKQTRKLDKSWAFVEPASGRWGELTGREEI